MLIAELLQGLYLWKLFLLQCYLKYRKHKSSYKIPMVTKKSV